MPLCVLIISLSSIFQAEIYKEDFLTERKDREKLKEKYLELENRFRKARNELHVLRSQVWRTMWKALVVLSCLLETRTERCWHTRFFCFDSWPSRNSLRCRSPCSSASARIVRTSGRSVRSNSTACSYIGDTHMIINYETWNFIMRRCYYWETIEEVSPVSLSVGVDCLLHVRPQVVHFTRPRTHLLTCCVKRQMYRRRKKKKITHQRLTLNTLCFGPEGDMGYCTTHTELTWIIFIKGR